MVAGGVELAVAEDFAAQGLLQDKPDAGHGQLVVHESLGQGGPAAAQKCAAFGADEGVAGGGEQVGLVMVHVALEGDQAQLAQGVHALVGAAPVVAAADLVEHQAQALLLVFRPAKERSIHLAQPQRSPFFQGLQYFVIPFRKSHFHPHLLFFSLLCLSHPPISRPLYHNQFL